MQESRTRLAFETSNPAIQNCVELPESDVALIRRVLIGIRDCEFRSARRASA